MRDLIHETKIKKQWILSYSSNPLLNTLHFLYWIAFSSLSKTNWTYTCRSISELSFLSHCLNFSVPQQIHSILLIGAMWQILKLDVWFLFSFSIFLSYSNSFLCPYKITSPITQKFYGIWLQISLNLYSHMGRIYIFTILNIPVPEHRNFLCLLRSSLIY